MLGKEHVKAAERLRKKFGGGEIEDLPGHGGQFAKFHTKEGVHVEIFHSKHGQISSWIRVTNQTGEQKLIAELWKKALNRKNGNTEPLVRFTDETNPDDLPPRVPGITTHPDNVSQHFFDVVVAAKEELKNLNF
ncbi:MAG: hypothetical protein KAW41_03415 [Candidatus Diapherotrites archaeon]|nr:hypothetical protein [Candidatus Diapherotrites archaeon]